jgi:hypothetical protein
MGRGRAIAGWSLQSWALIGLGLVLTAVGWARWAGDRRQDQTCHRPVSAPPVDTAPDKTADITTDASTDATTRRSNL